MNGHERKIIILFVQLAPIAGSNVIRMTRCYTKFGLYFFKLPYQWKIVEVH